MKEANGDQMEMLHSPSDAQHWYAEHSWIGIDGIYIGEQIPIKEPLLRHQISYYQGLKKLDVQVKIPLWKISTQILKDDWS